MSDTSPEIEHMVRSRYSAMQPVERFMIGVRMFESARAIVLASLPAGQSAEDLRRMLCERLYPELAAEAYGIRCLCDGTSESVNSENAPMPGSESEPHEHLVSFCLRLAG